jgi:ABC-type dipeptide/oligopeptide/nickel transport system permease subunit
VRGSIAAKISVFVGVLVLVISVGLGLIGYYSGSSAVIDQVEQALIMDVEEAVAYLETSFVCS